MVIVEKEADNRYLSIDSSKDGDIATITGEGEVKELKGEMKLNLPVKVGNDDLTYTPWPSSKNLLIDAWGTDTLIWIGKKFTILHVNKKMVIRPIKEEKVA
ncbi:MAG: hypothetical protein IH948_03775 [Bacteroidetes bacterium]|nr:hypothetical protein [Bacteroidota bacterium]